MFDIVDLSVFAAFRNGWLRWKSDCKWKDQRNTWPCWSPGAISIFFKDKLLSLHLYAKFPWSLNSDVYQKGSKLHLLFFSFSFCCLPCPAMYCHVLPYPTMSCHVLPCLQDMVLPWEELIAFSVKNSTFQLNRSLEQLGIFFVAMASPSLGLLRAIVEKQSDGSIGQKADMTWYIWRWTKREGVTLQWWFD